MKTSAIGLLTLLFVIFFSPSLCAHSGAGESFAHALPHPYHVGSVEVNYNEKSKTFEIIGKFFLDDLENGVKRELGSPVYFLDPKQKQKMHDALEDYLLKNLKIVADGKLVKIQFLGYEEQSESVSVYLESLELSLPKKLAVQLTVLYNEFDDQLNILHVIAKGKRQSTKLIYPKRATFVELI